MSSLAIANQLASFLVPIGILGAALAVVCAMVAGVALARGAAGLCGGAVGVWIVGAMLSVTASFGSVWMPMIVALVSLAVALVVGEIARGIVRVARSSATAPEPEPVVEASFAVAPKPLTVPVQTATVPTAA